MKRTIISVALLAVWAGALQASSVISCGGGGNALQQSTTCSNSSTYQSVLEDFGLNLQWNNGPDQTSGTLTATDPTNDPASADGVPYDTTWTDGNFSISGSSLELGDNYADVYRSGLWLSPYGSAPYAFQGNFDAPPDTAPPSGTTPGTPGDYLLGSGLVSDPGAVTISSTDPLSDIGFRIASQDLSSFDVVIQLFGQTGNLLQTLNATNTPLLGNLSQGASATCAGLGDNPPSPCNTAPFIALTGDSGVYSFSVITTTTTGAVDTGGFFLDSFYYNPETGETPEPASVLLTGAGIVSLLAFARRRNRRQPLGDVGAEAVDKP